MEFILYIFLWIISWFITGLDDLIIFSTLYKKSNKKISTLFWLIVWVILIIVLSFFIWNYIQYLGKIAIAGAFIPLFLSFKIIYGYIQSKYFQHDLIEETTHNKSFINNKNLFILSFLWYITNSVDDFLLNSSLIIWKSNDFIFLYFVWILIGCFIMISIAKRISKVKDYPLLRALILFIIWSIIFFNWFKVLFN